MRKPPALPSALSGRDFTTAQALVAGLSRNQLRGGAVRRVHHGLYVDAAEPGSLVRRVAAARRVLPDDAIVVGTTALRLLGIECGTAELTFATTRRHPVRRPDLRVRRLKLLPPHRDGVALAAYAFTGAATELGLVELVKTGDQLLRKRHATLAELVAAAAETDGRGKLLARRAAGLVRERVDSPRETWVRLLLTFAGLPEPELNARTYHDGAFLGRPDLRWEAYRTTVEYEGDQHRSDPGQWAYDIARYERFAAAGWTVVRIAAKATRDRRGLVRRVDRALRAGGYRGPEPDFNAEWLKLFG